MLTETSFRQAVRTSSVFLVGTFPPPVYGDALVTAAVRDRLNVLGGVSVVINLSADSLSRAWYPRLVRARRFIVGLVGFLWVAPRRVGSTLYISVAGGLGQVYNLLFVVLGRLLGQRNVEATSGD